jgi:hypothetical protein
LNLKEVTIRPSMLENGEETVAKKLDNQKIFIDSFNENYMRSKNETKIV